MNRLPSVLRGRAHVFGDHVSTDQILPGHFLDRSYEEVGRFAMAGIDDSFAARVQPGDFIVAGANFGCGSSREAAVIALKQVGVAAVIARSFARIFFRNAINNGLVPAVVPAVDPMWFGATLELDLARRVVRVRDDPPENGAVRAELPVLNLRGISLEILEAGGIIPYVRARMGLS